MSSFPAKPAATHARAANPLLLAAADIKLSHSIFALPFAVLGAFLARTADATGGWARFAQQLALVIVCMVLARTWAMMINRLADARIDADNPRTARRAIASGRLAYRDGLLIAAAAAALFAAAASCFGWLFGNWWPAILAFPVLAWLAFYSFAKRFTLLCHVLLGSALACSPLAAAIAVDPSALSRTPALWWLAGMVVLWVGGFDVIYALQDVDFDRSTGLHSIPSRLGPRAAIWLSRAMHAACAACLFIAARSDPRLGTVFFVAAALATALLILEHIILDRRGLAGLPMAFFTVNGVVSCVVGVLGVIDTLM
ncbi:MAG: 4-hydroxybenzoate octaprenyltransferase [Phycisphaerales bacterium]